jgi:prepilin-type N-terminal cleavage/methylation domain-containing protein
MAKADKKKNRSGVTLTELLVVISIMVILMTIMASALGAFTHTSRVDMAANTLATAFREARFYAMSKNVKVIPIVLRDTEDRLTVVYAAKALHFRGTLAASEDPPLTYAPAEEKVTQNPWTLTLKGLDGSALMDGAFVYMVGAPTLDLNNLGASQAYYELMQMKVTPPANTVNLNDSSQYTYEILARGVHNTARGTFNSTTSTAMLGVDGYVVVSGSNTGEDIPQIDARDYTLSGFSLPEDVKVDQVPSVESAGVVGPVQATIIAQAAIFQEEGSLLPDGGKHLPADHFPVFLPIFMPDGRVGTAIGTDLLGGLEVRHYGKAPFADRTLRVTDLVTREERFITITLNGMVYVSREVPAGYMREDGDPGIPSYVQIYDPSSTSASSTNSSTTSTNSSSSSSNSTTASTSTSTTSATSAASTSATSSNSSSTASTSSSTGTGSSTSTTGSTSSSSTSNSSTSTSNSATSATGASSSASTSSASSSSSSSTSSASSSSSTGTGSTSSTSASSSSASSASTSASSSATSSTNSSSASSANSTSTATTSGAVSSGGASSGGDDGTSTGGGRF